MPTKKLVYAGYAQIELTDETDAFVVKRETAKNRWEVMASDLVVMLNKGWSANVQPTDEGVKITSTHQDDIYGNGSQVWVSSEALDVLTAFSVIFWKLSVGCDWKPEPPASFGDGKRKYR